MMVPQALGNGTERGYYIFFDIKQWVRERVGLNPAISPLQLIYHSESLPSSTMIWRLFLLNSLLAWDNNYLQ